MIQWSEALIFCFFGVLIRLSVIFAFFPVIGEQSVPATVKILFSVLLAVAIFPSLISSGMINPNQGDAWYNTVSGISKTIGLEVLFGLAVGFVVRSMFLAVQLGSEVAGSLIGYSAATQYDPHFESQNQVISRLQMAVVTLLFLAVNGHYQLFSAALESYRVVGLGKTNLTGGFGEIIIQLSVDIFRTGIQMSAPFAIVMTLLNIVYGMIARAMPQLNILVLSLGINAIIGIFILYGSVDNMISINLDWFDLVHERILETLLSLKGA